MKTAQLIKHPRKYLLTPISGVTFPLAEATYAELYEYCYNVGERVRDIVGLRKYLTSIGVIMQVK